MFSCLQASSHVVDHHRMNKVTRMLVVYEDRRNSHLREQRHIERAYPRRCYENSINTSLVKGMNNFELAIGIRVGISKEDRITVIVGDFFDTVDHFGDKRVCNSGDYHADCFGSPGDQTAGNSAGAIAFFASYVADSLRSFVTDKRTVVQGS